MPHVVLLLVLTHVGCQACQGPEGPAGEDGDPGPRGEQGTPGTPGAAGGSYRWHDIHGKPVTRGEDLVAFDQDGYMWSIEAETGRWQGMVVIRPQFALKFSADVDCVSGYMMTLAVQEQGLVGRDDENGGVPAWPRVVLERAPSAEQPEVWSPGYFVRPDDLVAVCAEALVGWSSPTCIPMPKSEPCILGVPLSGMVEVTAPAAFDGPLHPEPVE